MFGSFLLGPYSALRLSANLAPESDLVQTVAVLAFALVFVGGTLLWTGLGIAIVVLGTVLNLFRGRLPTPPASKSERLVPPGYGAYVLLGAGFGVLVGGLSGLVTELTVLSGTAVWGLLGTTYGTALWLAARHGYLPFLEPE